MKCALEWWWDPPFAQKRVLLQSHMSGCSESFLSVADWSLRQRPLSRSEGSFEMIWSTKSAWQSRRVADCSRGSPEWGAAITTKHRSSNSWFETFVSQQKSFLSVSGNFARVRPLWWYGGSDLARLLSLLRHTTTVKLYDGYIVREQNGHFFSWKPVRCAVT